MNEELRIQDKEMLRRRCVELRQGLLPEDVSRLSRNVAIKVFGSDVWRKAKSVGLYCPIKNEVSTDALLRQAWQEGKKVLLPRCVIKEDESALEFVHCRDWSELVPGPFDLLEPEQSKVVTNGAEGVPDIVIVPAVGLTKTGYRLGYGKGYYDKLFAQPLWKDVTRIALAYSFQFVEFAPSSFDAPMHGYATELDFVWIS